MQESRETKPKKITKRAQQKTKLPNLGLQKFDKELEDLKSKMFKEQVIVRDFWGRKMTVEVRALEMSKAKMELQKKKNQEKKDHFL